MPLVAIAESPGPQLTWRVEVPRPRVWECLTEPPLLGQWLGALVAGAVVAEGDFVVDHGDGYLCASRIVEYAAPSRLAFTWHFADEPPSCVAVELEESGEATELRLHHRGLGERADSYRDGWCVHLSYLEAAALGTPLPPSMFWRLHGTVARLRSR